MQIQEGKQVRHLEIHTIYRYKKVMDYKILLFYETLGSIVNATLLYVDFKCPHDDVPQAYFTRRTG